MPAVPPFPFPEYLAWPAAQPFPFPGHMGPGDHVLACSATISVSGTRGWLNEVGAVSTTSYISGTLRVLVSLLVGKHFLVSANANCGANSGVEHMAWVADDAQERHSCSKRDVKSLLRCRNESRTEGDCVSAAPTAPHVVIHLIVAQAITERRQFLSVKLQYLITYSKVVQLLVGDGWEGWISQPEWRTKLGVDEFVPR